MREPPPNYPLSPGVATPAGSGSPPSRLPRRGPPASSRAALRLEIHLLSSLSLSVACYNFQHNQINLRLYYTMFSTATIVLNSISYACFPKFVPLVLQDQTELAFFFVLMERAQDQWFRGLQWLDVLFVVKIFLFLRYKFYIRNTEYTASHTLCSIMITILSNSILELMKLSLFLQCSYYFSEVNVHGVSYRKIQHLVSQHFVPSTLRFSSWFAL